MHTHKKKKNTCTDTHTHLETTDVLLEKSVRILNVARDEILRFISSRVWLLIVFESQLPKDLDFKRTTVDNFTHNLIFRKQGLLLFNNQEVMTAKLSLIFASLAINESRV